MKNKKQQNGRTCRAFTLAEVLITLAIIGVVAALTVPTVIISHRKTAYATQAAKTYTSFVQAFKTLMAKDGVFRLQDTKLWTMLEHATYFGDCGGGADCSASFASNINRPENIDIKEEFEKTFKVLRIFDGENIKIPVEGNKIIYKKLNGNLCAESDSTSIYCQADSAIALADGAYIDIYVYKPGTTAKPALKSQTKLWEPLGTLKVDVNGMNNPNQLGRDVFFYMIGSDGLLYAYGGLDYAKYTEHEDYYWKNENFSYNCETSNRAGLGCAGRLMEQGWKMKY